MVRVRLEQQRSLVLIAFGVNEQDRVRVALWHKVGRELSSPGGLGEGRRSEASK